jgi:hypothetical protein
MQKNRLLMIGMVVLVLTFIVFACSRKEEGGILKSDDVAKGVNSKDNFGVYPADYGIAYFNMVGYSPAPTVRGLFGPNAKFATSFMGTPAVVTLENVSGTAKEFTGQLLLTLKPPEQDDMKMMRLLVTFVSDDMSEMSYCRYIKLVSLVDGVITERRSSGDQGSDANVLGMFAGSMKYFWEE